MWNSTQFTVDSYTNNARDTMQCLHFIWPSFSEEFFTLTSKSHIQKFTHISLLCTWYCALKPIENHHPRGLTIYSWLSNPLLTPLPYLRFALPLYFSLYPHNGNITGTELLKYNSSPVDFLSLLLPVSLPACTFYPSPNAPSRVLSNTLLLVTDLWPSLPAFCRVQPPSFLLTPLSPPYRPCPSSFSAISFTLCGEGL